MHPPHIAAISRIMRDKQCVRKDASKGEGSRKRRHTIKYETLENALVEWIWDQYAGNVFVSDDLVKEKGRRILVIVNKVLRSIERIDLAFCTGSCIRVLSSDII